MKESSIKEKFDRMNQVLTDMSRGALKIESLVENHGCYYTIQYKNTGTGTEYWSKDEIRPQPFLFNYKE